MKVDWKTEEDLEMVCGRIHEKDKYQGGESMQFESRVGDSQPVQPS